MDRKRRVKVYMDCVSFGITMEVAHEFLLRSNVVGVQIVLRLDISSCLDVFAIFLRPQERFKKLKQRTAPRLKEIS
jgi:hypothetical protein